MVKHYIYYITSDIEMASKFSQAFILYIVCVAAFEDLLYVYGDGNREMMEHGRTHYKLIKERSSLPKYGPCWRAAIEHLDDGCRHLSEETQSDIALHITNCFLEMSGHETYNCEQDRKANLRAICISGMSDRAFNVYTEFYTHTQNICWFLRGQIWHETIAENTLKVGQQLKITSENQEDLLKAQKESLELQDKMIKHGRYLEQVLDDLYVSSKSHQEILKVLSQTVSNLQNWIIGEVSWFDSVIFYSMAIVLSFILTSSVRTMTARLPIFSLLFFNLLLERIICAAFISSGQQINIYTLYFNIYDFIWYSRYMFVFMATCVYIYKALIHKDLLVKNNELLCNIINQNNDILSKLDFLTSGFNPKRSSINIIDESSPRNIAERSNVDTDVDYASMSGGTGSIYRGRSWSKDSALSITKSISPIPSKENAEVKNSSINYHKQNGYTSKNIKSPLIEIQNGRYHLRSNSRQGTPDSTILNDL